MNRMGLMTLMVGLPLMVGQMCGLADPTNSQPQPENQGSAVESNAPTLSDKTVVGPGFSLSVPGQFDSYPDAIAPAQARHVDAYHDGQRLLMIWTETPVSDGFYRFDSTGTCIQEALDSDWGDFVLVAINTDAFSGAEDLAGYALLAGGDLLCVQVCAGRPITADDRAIGMDILRSISLDGTDGQVLESKMRSLEKRLLGYTSEGIIVLDDLSVLRLRADAGDAAAAEMRSWAGGDPAHHQSMGDDHQLLIIGRWNAVPVRDLGMALKTTIAEYDKSARKLVLGNGQTRYLPLAALPGFWAVGDEVLIINDDGRDWVVRTRSWHAIRL